ncbi:MULTISPECIES: metal-dependent hydrolase [unclassified Methanosarcina]|jgi:predicted transporter|uniref:metal-dependent hydrolase n=1 Tax=unclassified Methanosarcina TaxID=2644672 RepID=UPI00064FFE4A|nr:MULTISPECIES: metal-dependent hydrolase [unclassified Methanosarcina]
MLLFGHLGITLGAFIGLRRLIPRLKSVIDLRYLAIGALLPDLIDKPIGKVIFASTFANGRMIGHTLLFSCLLVLAGIYLYQKRRDTRICTLALGSFFHILEDQMWGRPQTFLWPLLGWSFPRDSIDYTGFEYLIKMLEGSFKPEFSQTYIAEIMGIGIIVIFTGIWIKKRLNQNSSD